MYVCMYVCMYIYKNKKQLYIYSHRKTACFQALVLDPHFAQMLRPLLATLLFPWLAEVCCKYLHVAAQVSVKPMFALSDAANAPAVCRFLAVASFQCFTRSNINCNRRFYIKRNQGFSRFASYK